jgi:hypothetical protein
MNYKNEIYEEITTNVTDYLRDHLVDAIIDGEPLHDIVKQAIYSSLPSKYFDLFYNDLMTDFSFDTEKNIIELFNNALKKL